MADQDYTEENPQDADFVVEKTAEQVFEGSILSESNDDADQLEESPQDPDFQ